VVDLRAKEELSVNSGIQEACHWIDAYGGVFEIVVIASSHQNRLQLSVGSVFLKGYADVIERSHLLAGKPFWLPPSISFHAESGLSEHAHIYTADAYSQVIRIAASLWAGTTKNKDGSIEYHCGSHNESSDDAAAISGLYLGLARVPQGLRSIYIYPGSDKPIALTDPS
jgi:hypothetical protein